MPPFRTRETHPNEASNEAEDITHPWHPRRPRGGRLGRSSLPGAGHGVMVLGAGGRASVRGARTAVAGPGAPRRGAVVNPILYLRHEVRRLPIGLDVAAKLTDESRQSAITEWTARMVDEHVSSRV